MSNDGPESSGAAPAESPERRAMMARIPLVRAQIRGLRAAADLAAEQAQDASEADKAGLALTSNMLTGFALELGLKLFFMAYHEEEVPHGHDLLDLYGKLPPQIQDDIAETFAGATPVLPTVTRFAFKLSPDRPDAPQANAPAPYGSATGLFTNAARLFVQARYFYEQINYDGWAIIDHPVRQLLRMSEVLDVVFDEYLRRGGWGPQADEPAQV